MTRSRNFRTADPDAEDADLSRAVELIRRVCYVAGQTAFLDEIGQEADQAGLDRALRERCTPPLYDWLVQALSFQGISDRVAQEYIRTHGTITWEMVRQAASTGTCPKLESFWHFEDCRFDKTSHTCAMPDCIERCALPSFRLRNGRLNQMAFSLFFFIRDVADSDLVGWLEDQLHCEDKSYASHRDQLIVPLRAIYGVSDKVASMAFSTILMCAPRERPDWFELGANIIVVDTLVHNFLHRTGIAQSCGTAHAYGVSCYRPGGCADILERAAAEIDARVFNPKFPERFARFVQHALWRYCATDGLNLCNGNRIDDRKPCDLAFCHVFDLCAKKPLKSAV